MIFEAKEYCALAEDSRLYLYALPEEECKANEERSLQQLRRRALFHREFIKKQYIGAGISCHSSLTAEICSCVNFATAVTAAGESFYVNTRSFCSYVVRKAACDSNVDMHARYLSDRVKENPETLKGINIVQSYLPGALAETDDVWQLVNRCAMLLINHTCRFSNYGSLHFRSPLTSPAAPLTELQEHALQAMLDNARLAIRERCREYGKLKGHAVAMMLQVVASEASVPSLELLKSLRAGNSSPLAFNVSAAAIRGVRPTMEDAHFCQEMAGGILAAIFDGHGGSAVAAYSARKMQKWFIEALKCADEDVGVAFELIADKLQQRIQRRHQWRHQGCTAVVCYLESHSRLVYTATIGDSEAKLYRRGRGGNIQEHLLSRVSNWAQPAEAARAAAALEDPSIIESWPKKRAKQLRFPNKYGLNVSRALGDQQLALWHGKPGVIHKPRVTVQLLQSGDYILIACDGLWDFVSPFDVVSIVSLRHKEPLAQRLVDFALKERSSEDNISAIAIEVK